MLCYVFTLITYFDVLVLLILFFPLPLITQKDLNEIGHIFSISGQRIGSFTSHPIGGEQEHQTVQKEV